MNVALFGGTGRTGRLVLDLCLARGWNVTALVRNRARATIGGSATLVEGDARDPASVARTLAHCDAVVCCLGMRDITVPATDFSDAVKTIVEAMHAGGVRRVVAIASAVVLPQPSGGLRLADGVPDALRNIAQEHARNYETLRRSGLDWTLMCPLDLKDDIPAGHAHWAYDGLPAESRETGYADLARAIVECLQDPASYGRRVGIVSVRPPRN